MLQSSDILLSGDRHSRPVFPDHLSFTMTTFSPELVEITVHDIWNSEMPSFFEKSFMTTCNRTWKAVYAPIASQDMYITNLAFLDYLSSTATLSPGLPVPLPASSTSEQINGKARQKWSIVISLTYPISVVSKLCSNTSNVYPSGSFGWICEKIYRYYHRSVTFLFESAKTGSFPVIPSPTTAPGRRECVYTSL